MELQVGVKILLKNKDGKFLFLHKNPEKYPNIKINELLDIVGGRINIGDPLLDNLRREIFEETKLHFTGEPRLLAAQDILRKDKHVVRLTYIGDILGEPEVDNEEISYMWLTKEEALSQSNLDPYSREVLTKFT